MYHSTEYKREFWDAMRGKPVSYRHIEDYKNTQNGSYRLPSEDNKKFESIRRQENIFRQIGTVVKAPKGDSTLWLYDNKPELKWIDKDNPVFYESTEEFEKYKLSGHQLGGTVLLAENFCQDAAFDLEGHVTKEFAQSIGQLEEEAFICGGDNAPSSFMDDAGIGHSTSEISYDDVIRLYFSLDKKYRRKAVWVMNDDTALKLRTLKDSSGAYLWNYADNTILGKRVYISNFMPNEEAGAKPIAFGDFSYFWIVDRWPFALRKLTEIFVPQQQVGFMGYELLDAKLIRPDAVKLLEISG